MRHTFWRCLIRCANMKWIRWVLLKIQSGHDSVHRRTDGQTDKVIPVYPPFNFVEAEGIISYDHHYVIWHNVPISFQQVVTLPHLAYKQFIGKLSVVNMGSIIAVSCWARMVVKHSVSHRWGISVLNSFWPSDAIWRQRSRSTLVRVMACCLTAPSHYLNQCWLIISKIEWHSSEGNFTAGISAINHCNWLEKNSFKISLKFPRPQWVNTQSPEKNDIHSAHKKWLHFELYFNTIGV